MTLCSWAISRNLRRKDVLFNREDVLRYILYKTVHHFTFVYRNCAASFVGKSSWQREFVAVRLAAAALFSCSSASVSPSVCLSVRARAWVSCARSLCCVLQCSSCSHSLRNFPIPVFISFRYFIISLFTLSASSLAFTSCFSSAFFHPAICLTTT